MQIKHVLLSLVISSFFLSGNAQITADENISGGYITTAVPFLTITPDSRAAGMGDLGVATSPDANSSFWNPAKYAFYTDEKADQGYNIGGALSYTPWLRKLVSDMSVNYLTGYKRLSKQEVVYASFKYFDLGSMTFRDDQGTVTRDVNPYELALSFGYSRMLSKRIGASLGVKWIHSNLTGSVSVSQGGQLVETQAGNTIATDLGFFYQNKDIKISGKAADLNIGATITDLGGKITYTSAENAQHIPTTLRLGSALNTKVDLYNQIGFSLEFSKLLVPTPQADGSTDPNGNIFTSFTDAPGGFKEEMQEIMIAFGAEYVYADALALRGGYFYENPNKGSRRYFTLGLGLMYKDFGFDFAYLIPTDQNNPLQNTIRFTLTFNKLGVAKGASPDGEGSIIE
tara:strand:- start:105 stop:1301 length:1197 start_codon:yes stop_codon:yes gene_type:complete